MTTIEDINSYLTIKETRLKFTSIQDLVDAYLSCRETNKSLLQQSIRTIEQVKAEIEHEYTAALARDTYQLSQLEKMTLLELAKLIN